MASRKEWQERFNSRFYDGVNVTVVSPVEEFGDPGQVQFVCPRPIVNEVIEGRPEVRFGDMAVVLVNRFDAEFEVRGATAVMLYGDWDEDQGGYWRYVLTDNIPEDQRADIQEVMDEYPEVYGE